MSDKSRVSKLTHFLHFVLKFIERPSSERDLWKWICKSHLSETCAHTYPLLDGWWKEEIIRSLPLPTPHSFILPGDSWLVDYYQQGSLIRWLSLITKSLINRRKPVLEQYPEEKRSELRLPGNRLWMVVKFGAIYRERRQLKRDLEGWEKVWAQCLLKRAFRSSFQSFKNCYWCCHRGYIRKTYSLQKKEDLFLYQIFI